MAPDGVERLPDLAPAIAVAEQLLRGRPRGDDDGKDDVSHPLALGPAHDPPDGLHHLDLAPARMHEQDAVERRQVDALGEAPGVGQDAALALVGGIQPGQGLPPPGRAERAVDVPDGGAVIGKRIAAVPGAVHGPVRSGEVLEPALDPSGRLDRPAEGDGAPHRHALPRGKRVRVGLGQGAPAADHQRRVVELQPLRGIGRVFRQDPGRHVLGNRQDDDPVVGEEVALHRRRETELVQDRPVEPDVIHRAQRRGQLARPRARALRVDLGRGGHVEPPGRTDAAVLVDPREVRRLLALDDGAGGAVRLVADREVEPGQAVCPLRRLQDRG